MRRHFTDDDFRAELPRHETGKLYKRVLKEEYVRARQERPASLA